MPEASTSTNEIRGRSGQQRLPSWRWEALRTTFWLVPTLLVLVAGVLFLITFEIDWAIFHKHLSLPFWIVTGGADRGPRGADARLQLRSSPSSESCSRSRSWR